MYEPINDRVKRAISLHEDLNKILSQHNIPMGECVAVLSSFLASASLVANRSLPHPMRVEELARRIGDDVKDIILNSDKELTVQ